MREVGVVLSRKIKNKNLKQCLELESKFSNIRPPIIKHSARMASKYPDELSNCYGYLCIVLKMLH